MIGERTFRVLDRYALGELPFREFQSRTGMFTRHPRASVYGHVTIFSCSYGFIDMDGHFRFVVIEGKELRYLNYF